ncbi:hypothetical protein QQF64_019765 [Cirrhinus molitorella]|uniref:Endonuclease/exonuclease/phosphatase domain-containing protein n=1 Tax=Cirrhinus molitorella TaxID=172907 RepID=A0ABR3LJR7_9TELE
MTLKGASVPITLLSTRATTSIGAWNVKTMYEAGKAAQVSAEMHRYNITLLGLSKTRWLQARQTRLGTGELLLYSGHEDENAAHTEGVAFMLSSTAQKALVGWEAHGPRMITASFRTKKNIKMNVIQCYAPTNGHDKESKNQFYNRLQAVLDSLKDKDVNILMGDFNAKVGSDNRGYKEVMGQHALGEINENREKFVDICRLNKLVIGGSIFAHKRIHKATWDVRVKKGADAATDHHLLTTRLKLKLKRNDTQPAGSVKYNLSLLKDQQIKAAYTLTLKNRFQVLQELITEETDVQELWHGMRDAITETCKEILRPKKHKHKDWISMDTLQKIQVRRQKKEVVNSSQTRASKAAAQAEYAQAQKEVKKSVKKDKRDFIEGLVEEAEQVAYNGNMKELYDTTKKLAGKYSKPERPVKNKQGQTITNTEEQLGRWADHFEELLNRPAPENPPNIAEAGDDIEICCTSQQR